MEAAQPPAGPEDRQYLKDKVAEIVAERRGDFDRFQAMKRKASVKEGVAVRFELIELVLWHLRLLFSRVDDWPGLYVKRGAILSRR